MTGCRWISKAEVSISNIPFIIPIDTLNVLIFVFVILPLQSYKYANSNTLKK